MREASRVVTCCARCMYVQAPDINLAERTRPETCQRGDAQEAVMMIPVSASGGKRGHLNETRAYSNKLYDRGGLRERGIRRGMELVRWWWPSGRGKATPRDR